jgi:hypothetical protein
MNGMPRGIPGVDEFTVDEFLGQQGVPQEALKAFLFERIAANA